MAQIGKLARRFQELADQQVALAATKIYKDGSYSGEYVDSELFINWKLKVRNLLSLACGEESTHYRDFVKQEEMSTWATNHADMLRLKAVFDAAREDFEGGYLTSMRNLVQAEVFANELEQAEELFKGGYITAAAVIAGVVLETSMRQLCDDQGIAHGSLNKMNDDLAKADAYSLLVKKRITALADIRNNAAHGNSTEYTKDDVKDMIGKVEGFVADDLPVS